jgi:hypothetical protein
MICSKHSQILYSFNYVEYKYVLLLSAAISLYLTGSVKCVLSVYFTQVECNLSAVNNLVLVSM